MKAFLAILLLATATARAASVSGGLDLVFKTNALIIPAHNSTFMTSLVTNYVTLSGVLRTNGGSAQLASVVFNVPDDTSRSIALFLFSQPPTWTGVPGAAVNIPAADYPYRRGFIQLDAGSYCDLGSVRSVSLDSLRLQVNSATTTNVYALVVALGAYSWSGTYPLASSWIRD